MGTFSVEVTIAHPNIPDRRSTVELLIDTGALFSFLPEDLLTALGIVPHRREEFVTISGGTIHRKVGRALFILDGKEEVTPVVFTEGGDSHVLGALTLGALGFLVDPAARKLIARKAFPAA